MESARLPIRIYDATKKAYAAVNNISYHAGEPIPDSMIESARNIKIFEGAPQNIIELNDAYYVPGNSCLYRSDGERVIESCIRRGENMNEFIEAEPECVTPPKDYITLTDPVLYLLLVPHGWGHFLTEAISRLWLRILFSEFNTMSGFYCYSWHDTFGDRCMEFMKHFNLYFDRNI